MSDVTASEKYLTDLRDIVEHDPSICLGTYYNERTDCRCPMSALAECATNGEWTARRAYYEADSELDGAETIVRDNYGVSLFSVSTFDSMQDALHNANHHSGDPITPTERMKILHLIDHELQELASNA